MECTTTPACLKTRTTRLAYSIQSEIAQRDRASISNSIMRSRGTPRRGVTRWAFLFRVRPSTWKASQRPAIFRWWTSSWWDPLASYISLPRMSTRKLCRVVSEGLPVPARLLGAVSRKVHGAAGTFDLPLSLSQAQPTTNRGKVPDAEIMLTFDKEPVTGAWRDYRRYRHGWHATPESAAYIMSFPLQAVEGAAICDGFGLQHSFGRRRQSAAAVSVTDRISGGRR